MKPNDNHSLSHSTWNCKYHIVFAPKYRRKVFYKENRVEIGKILRTLCNWKEVNIVEAEVCPDHIHMLVEIPPKMSVASFVGFLKGKSSLIIFERHSNLKYKYGNRQFWCRGYYEEPPAMPGGSYWRQSGCGTGEPWITSRSMPWTRERTALCSSWLLLFSRFGNRLRKFTRKTCNETSERGGYNEKKVRTDGR